MKAYVETVPEVENGTNIINRRKLISGRIDGYLGYPIDEILSLKGTEFEGKLEMHPMSLIKTGGLYFMLSKKANSQKTADKLQNSLEKIKTDGTYQEILQKYSKKYGISEW